MLDIALAYLENIQFLDEQDRNRYRTMLDLFANPMCIMDSDAEDGWKITDNQKL